MRRETRFIRQLPHYAMKAYVPQKKFKRTSQWQRKSVYELGIAFDVAVFILLMVAIISYAWGK